MRTTNFDAIAASAPLDRQASVVRDGSGDIFVSVVPANKVSALHSVDPLPVVEPPPGARDLTGLTWGFFRVLGLYEADALRTGRNARWVVRCVCGRYETRRTKALTEPCPIDRGGSRCFDCDRTNILRKRANRPITTQTRADEVARLDELARRA